VTTGAYNADKWISPSPEPGDIVLFPSYLMHAVPTNRVSGASRCRSTPFRRASTPGLQDLVQWLKCNHAPFPAHVIGVTAAAPWTAHQLVRRARARGGVGVRGPRLPDRVDAANFVVAGPRISGRAAVVAAFFGGVSVGALVAGSAHRSQRHARALVRGMRGRDRVVELGARIPECRG